jgi:hypothetical protein
MPPANTKFKSKKCIFEALVLFGALALAILYSVKSWWRFFFIGLAEHWDPKLMGEWMAWNAHNILNGHFLLPNYHANFFYPHSYTLAFSELLWPESFLYALFYSLTGNIFFSFNATMLSFWVLSGLALFALLRMLDISPLVSALGSLIYCLMPYRMPYLLLRQISKSDTTYGVFEQSPNTSDSAKTHKCLSSINCSQIVV